MAAMRCVTAPFSPSLVRGEGLTPRQADEGQRHALQKIPAPSRRSPTASLRRHPRRSSRRSSLWRSTAPSRRRCRKNSPSRPKCRTATASCCAPSPRPTAIGGSTPASTRSTRNSSTCWSPMRTSASGIMTASTCWRWPAPPASSSTNGRIVSGGSTLSMQLARLIEPRESRSLGSKIRQMLARHADRAAALQARDPRALPDAGALWRQSGRRARRLARLFRQGAEAADRLGSGPAGRPAATAGKAPARPQPRQCARRARPRADPHGSMPACSANARPPAPRSTMSRVYAAHCRRSPLTLRMPCCRKATPGKPLQLTIRKSVQEGLEQVAKEAAAQARSARVGGHGDGRRPDRRHPRRGRFGRLSSTPAAPAGST